MTECGVDSIDKLQWSDSITSPPSKSHGKLGTNRKCIEDNTLRVCKKKSSDDGASTDLNSKIKTLFCSANSYQTYKELIDEEPELFGGVQHYRI
jgi:hypothetical protein